jgi:hypothetical protein
MFGANVVSDWKEGGQIVWKGEWQGKVYEDKGVILKIEPERVSVSFNSATSALFPDFRTRRKISHCDHRAVRRRSADACLALSGQ